MKKTPGRTLADVRNELRAFRGRGFVWRVITDEYPDGDYRIPLGTLSRIANDPNYEPRKTQVLKALGLPALAPAPVCAHCGIVHLAKRCPARDRFAENAAEYDAWRAAHASELAGVVAWAEGKESC